MTSPKLEVLSCRKFRRFIADLRLYRNPRCSISILWEETVAFNDVVCFKTQVRSVLRGIFVSALPLATLMVATNIGLKVNQELLPVGVVIVTLWSVCSLLAQFKLRTNIRTRTPRRIRLAEGEVRVDFINVHYKYDSRNCCYRKGPARRDPVGALSRNREIILINVGGGNLIGCNHLHDDQELLHAALVKCGIRHCQQTTSMAICRVICAGCIIGGVFYLCDYLATVCGLKPVPCFRVLIVCFLSLLTAIFEAFWDNTFLDQHSSSIRVLLCCLYGILPLCFTLPMMVVPIGLQVAYCVVSITIGVIVFERIRIRSP